MIAGLSSPRTRTIPALAVLLLVACGLGVGLAAAKPTASDDGARPDRWVSCTFTVPSDGVVPLRDEPSFGASIVAQMDAVDGWFLAAKSDDRRIVRGAWMYVLYVPPIALGSEGVESLGRSGWMHRSLEAGCDA
jgi:hypothetical protein